MRRPSNLADRIIIFTPRPARVEREIRVSFGRPRHEAMKNEALFLELRREIWEVLKKGARL